MRAAGSARPAHLSSAVCDSVRESSMAFPPIVGLGHIDLTVTDIERSARWWQEVLGFQLVAQNERSGFRVWNVFHPSFLVIGLVAHDDAALGSFDERVVGLDHLALRVPDRAALEAWVG